MGVSLQNLIDLNLLTRYDKNLKEWVSGQLSIAPTPEGKLPETGVENTIYVSGTSLYLWDGGKYLEISAGEDEWVDF